MHLYYHLLYLERCKRRCDILIVGVNSDRSVTLVKGDTRPVYHENHRVRLVDNSKHVDIAFIMDGIVGLCKFHSLVDVDVVFNNGQFGDDTIGAEKPGVELIIVPNIKNCMSTTAFISQILASNNGKD